MRTEFIAGNWKMFNGPASTVEFFMKFQNELDNACGVKEAAANGEEEIVFFVPAISLTAAVITAGKMPVSFGAQNVHWEEKGAFTGEISVPMLQEARAKYVIIGHSERRHIFHETDGELNKKITAAINGGLTVVFCVGELLEEREAGTARDVIKRQFNAGLDGIDAAALKQVIIAYEPVWAIGTGKTASAEDAEEICAFIRSLVRDKYGAEASEAIRVLYGGSVKPENTSEIMACENIDGVLVGGASLKPESFIKIAENAIAKPQKNG